MVHSLPKLHLLSYLFMTLQEDLMAPKMKEEIISKQKKDKEKEKESKKQQQQQQQQTQLEATSTVAHEPTATVTTSRF